MIKCEQLLNLSSEFTGATCSILNAILTFIIIKKFLKMDPKHFFEGIKLMAIFVIL